MLLDLVTKVLQYSPIKRITPAEAIMHEYFDELRDEARYQ
jgi:serine/threonine protein kinase